MYALALILEYEGVDHFYFTTEGKAYKKLIGSLCPIANENHPGGQTHWIGFKYPYIPNEVRQEPYFWAYRDDWYISKLKVEE